MKKSTTNMLWIAVGVPLVLLLSAMLPAQEESWPLRDVVVPLDLYENGDVRAEIRADAARLPTNGVSQAKGIALSFYTPSGASNGVVTAGRCTYSRAERKVTSQDRVRVEKGNVIITAKGLEWRSDAGKVWLKDDVRVQFSGVPLVALLEEQVGRKKEGANSRSKRPSQ